MLSIRGTKWSAIDYAHGKPNTYHPLANPTGDVVFGFAENRYMHDAFTQFIKSNEFDMQCCAYGEGYTGTLRLRQAMAGHLNAFFHPASRIDADEITFAAGVTSLNEACALVTCDEGDAIILGRPVYGAFNRDLTMRTGVRLEYVSVGDEDQFDLACVAAFEAGLEAAQKRGVKVKALIICNPHNPLGRCYPRETLVELLRFCCTRGIHLISDEIYALSVYHRDDQPCEKFTSVKAIDLTNIINPAQVHVLYGMSKNFGAAGLRLGCIISQNKQLTDSIRATCRFSSPSQISMLLAAQFLEDQDFVKSFLQQSHLALRDSRIMAERLLEESKIPYSKTGNAGLFIWLDLGPFLPIDEAGGDIWEAERLLNRRLRQQGVFMSTSETYNAPNPGRFRLVFSLEEHIVREGIRRISQVISAR